MTVKELIAELGKYEPEYEVLVLADPDCFLADAIKTRPFGKDAVILEAS